MTRNDAVGTAQRLEVAESDPTTQTPDSDLPASYHIMTWGCQMNEEDSEQIGLYLERMGYRRASGPDDADVVMLNTCSVRAKPEEKVWSELGRLRDIKKSRPDMVIGVCGCMAQVESEEIKRRAPYVDLIVGTGNIAAIPELIASLQVVRSAGPEVDSELKIHSSEGRTFHIPALKSQVLNPISMALAPKREQSVLTALALPPRKEGKREEGRGKREEPVLTALALPPRKGAIVSEMPQRVTARAPKLKAHVPIMYGCDKFCTFCIVPLTRGRERSRPTEEILIEIEGLARNGTREVTLLGQTVNSYGKNMPEGRVPFCDLLQKIDAIRGIQRIRFTSPYPRDFTDDLIDAIGRLPKVCEHVHLPLQVGDDDLLAQMHRGYTVARYREIVEKLRARVPGIAITTDIMLGYPGETDEQYRNTLGMVEEIRFDSAFMFAYSPRPNTKAAAQENQIPREVKIERLSALIALQNRITCEVNAMLVGQTAEVLVEGRSPKDPSRLTGYTRTLKTVNFSMPEGEAQSEDSLVGKLVPIRLIQSHLTGFTGEIART